MIPNIHTPEQLSVKNLDDLTREVYERAETLPEGVSKVLAEIVMETAPKKDEHTERAAIVFGECMYVTSGYAENRNKRNMIEDMMGTLAERSYRELLGEFDSLLNLESRKQGEFIEEHYEDPLKKARLIEKTLETLRK